VYHLVSGGPGVTWYGFANEFLGLLGLETPREPVPLSTFPRPAARPKFAALRNTRFPPLPERLEALRRYLSPTRID
jgi:dTDP-4-dehydrorhamnose reductase